MIERRNPIDAILDPNYNGNVVLYDSEDKGIEFEQVCLVPINRQIYCILRPVKKQLMGLGDNEALVFQIIEKTKKEDALIFVNDKTIIDKVFDIYYKLLDNKG